MNSLKTETVCFVWLCELWIASPKHSPWHRRGCKLIVKSMDSGQDCLGSNPSSSALSPGAIYLIPEPLNMFIYVMCLE